MIDKMYKRVIYDFEEREEVSKSRCIRLISWGYNTMQKDTVDKDTMEKRHNAERHSGDRHNGECTQWRTDTMENSHNGEKTQWKSDLMQNRHNG